MLQAQRWQMPSGLTALLMWPSTDCRCLMPLEAPLACWQRSLPPLGEVRRCPLALEQGQLELRSVALLLEPQAEAQLALRVVPLWRREVVLQLGPWAQPLWWPRRLRCWPQAWVLRLWEARLWWR